MGGGGGGGVQTERERGGGGEGGREEGRERERENWAGKAAVNHKRFKSATVGYERLTNCRSTSDVTLNAAMCAI